MLFRRRQPAALSNRLRVALWPRHSWSRSARYFAKRVLRLSGSPHAVAAGVAAGVFASFTPFLGFHFIIGIAIAFLIGGNFLAAALGTAFGNPITFPIIWATTYKVGGLILGLGSASAALPHLGVPTAVAFYFISLYAVRAFQRVRVERLAARRRERDSAALAPAPAPVKELERT
jgi:hypothetical protein